MICEMLSKANYGRRMNCCNRILVEILPIGTVLITDQAHFHRFGEINKQRFRYWAVKNSQERHARLLHSSKVTARCVASSIVVFRLYVFKMAESQFFFNSNRYYNMLKNFPCPKIKKYEYEYNLEEF